MPTFRNVAKAAPVTRPAASVPEISIEEIEWRLQSVPLQTVDCRGRVQLIYGSQEGKYPAVKLILGNTEGEFTSILVKFNALPRHEADQGSRSRVVVMDEAGHDYYPKAEFHLASSLRDVVLLGEDTYASVQCRVAEVGPVSGAEDKPRRTIQAADIPEEGAALSTERFNILLYDGHAFHEDIKAESDVAIIGVAVRGLRHTPTALGSFRWPDQRGD
eukprot:s2161_g10.t1